MTSTD